jgi:uncharacterized protein (TIRG00374 family)
MVQFDKHHKVKLLSGSFRTLFIGIILLSGLIVAITHFGEIEHFIYLMQNSRPSWLVLAFLLQVATYFSVAVVWQLALRQGGMRFSLLTLAPLGVAKLFSDQAMPSGGITGTAFFVAALKRRGVPPPLCLGAMLISLVTYYAAYLLAAVTSIVLLHFHHAINPWVVSISILFSVVAVAIPCGVLLLKQWGLTPLFSWLSRFPGVRTLLQAFADAPSDLLHKPALVVAAISYQAAVFLLDSATLWVMLKAIGESVSLSVAFPSFVLASIAATLAPIPLGLGTFEATCVAMLRLLGIQIEAALTATLLLRGFTLWLPMLPGLWLTRREMR